MTVKLNVGDIVQIPMLKRPCWFLRMLGMKERTIYCRFKIVEKV